MIAGTYNITAYKNCDLMRVFSVDFDITSYTIKGTIKKNTSSVNFIVTKINANSFQIFLDKDAINLLDIGNYEYDILIKDSITTKLIKGKLIVENSVTVI